MLSELKEQVRAGCWSSSTRSFDPGTDRLEPLDLAGQGEDLNEAFWPVATALARRWRLPAHLNENESCKIKERRSSQEFEPHRGFHANGNRQGTAYARATAQDGRVVAGRQLLVRRSDLPL